jgi:hypothetical protein
VEQQQKGQSPEAKQENSKTEEKRPTMGARSKTGVPLEKEKDKVMRPGLPGRDSSHRKSYYG